MSVLGRVFGSVATLGLILLELAALLLAPFRIGRMLRSVSLPRMREHRVRTTLTLIGAALGVSVLVSVVIVSRSVARGVNDTIDDLAGKADLQIGAGSAGFDEALLDVAREVPGVYRVTPVMQQVVTLREGRADGERMLLMGVDLLGKEDEYFRSYGSAELHQIRRDPLAFLNSETNVIISRGLAKRFGYKLRDTISFGTGSGVQRFTIWGFVDDEGVGRAFGGSVAVMYYPAMQVAFSRGRNLDRIDVAVDEGTDVEAVKQRLQAALGEGVAIEAASLRGGRVEKMLEAVSVALGMASLIALTTALFLIYNTMSISVVQRRRELGLLRALGTTRGELLRLIMLEGALLGSVSAVLGVLFAVGLADFTLRLASGALTEVYLQQQVTDVELDFGLIGIAFVLGALGTTLASAIPARQAGRAKPAEALRTSGIAQLAPRTARVQLMDVLGVGLIGGALALLRIDLGEPALRGPLATVALLVGGALLIPRLVQLSRVAFLRLGGRNFGAEAELASGNVTRDLGRTTATAAALMAGAALTVGFGTFSTSFLRSMNDWSAQLVPGDLFVTSGASVAGLNARNTPMAAEFLRELERVPGVELVRPTRIAEIDYRGYPIKLGSTDTQKLGQHSKVDVLEGGSQDELLRAMRERGAVYVSENLSNRFDLHAGGSIALGARGGTRQFPIAGVVVDYTSDIGTVVMDRATYVEAFGDERVDTFELHLASGANIEQVRSAISKRYGQKHDLFVLTNKEFRGEFDRAANRIFDMLWTLQLVTLVVSALSIVNAVLANVLDRVREIGVLRAIGMLRLRVRRMVVLEATMLGMFGAIAGIAVGLGLGYVLNEHVMSVQTGWRLPYHAPFRAMLEVILVALPISALAGVYPAKAAADLVVSDALEYE
jgi:putative ABC transport system permease protein